MVGRRAGISLQQQVSCERFRSTAAPRPKSSSGSIGRSTRRWPIPRRRDGWPISAASRFLARSHEGARSARLRSLKETSLGHEIRVFGNVAIAIAVCEITENEAQVTRGVENDASRQDRRVLANRFPSLGRARRVEADTSGPSPNSVRGRRKPRRSPLNRPVTGRNDDSGSSNAPIKPPFHTRHPA
jgi:hypothetical protein